METLTIRLSINDLKVDPSTGNIIINIDGNSLKPSTNNETSLAGKNGKKYKKSRFSVFMESLIDNLLSKGKKRSAEAYKSALNSFMEFKGKDDFYVYEIKATMLEKYQAWLKRKGLTMNSISFYMRILRTVYNQAVECNLTENTHPFRRVYTGIAKTIKRSVTLDVMKEIRHFKTNDPNVAFARDMFLFSFYTRGMSFIDMAHLTIGNLQGGVLCYRRQKTAQQLCIKWADLMQQIVTKYQKRDSPYLLPLACGRGATFQHRYKNTYKRIGKQLKKLGEMLQLPIPLTTYVARHSWASIAKSKNVELSTISEALGHDSEKTTRIYLSSLDTSLVDKANNLIINSI